MIVRGQKGSLGLCVNKTEVKLHDDRLYTYNLYLINKAAKHKTNAKYENLVSDEVRITSSKNVFNPTRW